MTTNYWDLGRIWRKLLEQETRGWGWSGVGHHPERVGEQDGGDHLLTELSILRRYLNPTPFLAMMQNSSSPAVRSILEVNIGISKEQLLGWIFPPRQLLPSHLYHR